ncbi:DUF4279 domain-containing protein [Permianibacter sp. IMCC34836]|nr:DUF4279 domain-containing protein [Permianibacter fluminis]
MAQIDHSAVSLRVIGDTLAPDEISKLLGAKPTFSHSLGEILVGKKTGVNRVAKFGMWQMNASDCAPENLDGQIDEILSKLTENLAVWSEIGERYKVDLFCGLFMVCRNEGLSLSPRTLFLIGQRGISLGLDIYGPIDESKAV